MIIYPSPPPPPLPPLSLPPPPPAFSSSFFFSFVSPSPPPSLPFLLLLFFLLSHCHDLLPLFSSSSFFSFVSPSPPPSPPFLLLLLLLLLLFLLSRDVAVMMSTRSCSVWSCCSLHTLCYPSLPREGPIPPTVRYIESYIQYIDYEIPYPNFRGTLFSGFSDHENFIHKNFEFLNW